MAARNRKGLSENTRARIKTSMIINRLTDHIFGKVELSASQVSAALGLIKKTIPDLQSTELKAEVTERKVISAEPMNLDEWKTEYSSDVAASTGATESIN